MSSVSIWRIIVGATGVGIVGSELHWSILLSLGVWFILSSLIPTGEE